MHKRLRHARPRIAHDPRFGVLVALVGLAGLGTLATVGALLWSFGAHAQQSRSQAQNTSPTEGPTYRECYEPGRMHCDPRHPADPRMLPVRWMGRYEPYDGIDEQASRFSVPELPGLWSIEAGSQTRIVPSPTVCVRRPVTRSALRWLSLEQGGFPHGGTLKFPRGKNRDGAESEALESAREPVLDKVWF